MRACLILTLVLFLSTTLLRAETPAPGKQVEQHLDLGDDQTIGYHLYLPDDYVATKPHAFMLFLHGRGESYGPLSLVKQWGPPKLVDDGQKLPYIIASPQCPKESSWSQSAEQTKLVRLLEHLEKTYAIDSGRMYLTGLSMGGFGSWTLAASHPDKFAAVAPICGKGNPADATKLKDVPIWAWHGLNDKAVAPEGTAAIVNAIREAGGTKVIHTTLEGVGHNSWSAAYATPELYQWMNKHSLETVEEAVAE